MASSDTETRSTEHLLSVCFEVLAGLQGAEAVQGGRCLPASTTTSARQPKLGLRVVLAACLIPQWLTHPLSALSLSQSQHQPFEMTPTLTPNL